MSFKFEAPFKLPRWTTEEFKELKVKYQAKYGTTVHIPGWDHIFKWDTTREPDKEELAAYKRKDVAFLGDVRYAEIKKLMLRKKADFLRMLSSPTPNIVQNASSIMTTLDDVNDALGTFAVALRVLARKLPSMFSKFLTGPAGWVLTGAELAGVVQQLTCLPFKARNIQHEINDYMKGHPLSKKAKLRRLKKLKKIGLSKGEIIEGLQTTENMFGVGLSLGPIMGLLWDIPSGLYKHVKGEKVSVAGLPWPLLWYDRLSSRVLKYAATLWTGLPPEFDEDLGKSMVVVNWSAQIARVIMPFFNYQSIADDLKNILLRFPVPQFPSTLSVLEDELGESYANMGWPFSSHEWIPTTHIFETGLDQIQENVSAWRERNKSSMEAVIGIQNQVEAGLHIIGALETDEDIELEYDPHTDVMLKLLNQGYRIPCPIEPEQGKKFYKDVNDHYDIYGELTYRDGLLIAHDLNCFKFSTKRPTVLATRVDITDMSIVDIRSKPDLLRCDSLIKMTEIVFKPYTNLTLRYMTSLIIRITSLVSWLDRYGWPLGNPTTEFCFDISEALSKLFNQLGIPITKTSCCSIHALPLFEMDMLPPNLRPPAFVLLPETADPAFHFNRLEAWLAELKKSIGMLGREEIARFLKKIYPVLHLLLDKGWPTGQPTDDLCELLHELMDIAFSRLDMPIKKQFLCHKLKIPWFSQNMLPPDTWRRY